MQRGMVVVDGRGVDVDKSSELLWDSVVERMGVTWKFMGGGQIYSHISTSQAKFYSSYI